MTSKKDAVPTTRFYRGDGVEEFPEIPAVAPVPPQPTLADEVCGIIAKNCGLCESLHPVRKVLEARAAAPAVEDAPTCWRCGTVHHPDASCGEDATPRTPLRDWLEERRQNCLRIAEQKTGNDKTGWLEDAEYFRAAIAALAASTRTGQP
jgi:hypothetical protein